ncbi:MAG: hypothetical protein ACE37K_09785 [Planctomycetota bacterium]
MNGPARFRRWRYIVDWKLQGSLIAHGLVYGVVVLAAIGLGIFAPLLWNLGAAGHEDAFEEQSIVMLYLHERFWAIAGVCLVIVVVGAVRFSHRIAGPMVRYKRNLRLLADGKMPPPLRTRSADFLKDEVVVLNRAVAGVAARVEAIRRAQLDVRRRVAALDEQLDETPEELRQLVASCEQLDSAVRTFDHVDTPDDVALPFETAVAEAEPVGQPGGA